MQEIIYKFKKTIRKIKSKIWLFKTKLCNHKEIYSYRSKESYDTYHNLVTIVIKCNKCGEQWLISNPKLDNQTRSCSKKRTKFGLNLENCLNEALDMHKNR